MTSIEHTSSEHTEGERVSTKATEGEAASLFPDGEPGAVSPIGTAYDLRSLIGQSLEEKPEIYFEGGDHQTLNHISGDVVHRLMEKVPHARISLRSTADEAAFPYFEA